MSFASFTPISGLIGGGLIGVSAGTLLLFNGDILGASGIVSSTALDPIKSLTDPSQLWKLVFLSSLLLTSTVYYGPTFELPADGPSISSTGYMLAGLLVGFGTKLGNGCTTGHGICGLARMSKRSLASVITFMGSAVASTYLTGTDSPLSNWTSFLRTESAATTAFTSDALFGGRLLTLSVIAAAVTAATVMVYRGGGKTFEQQTQVKNAAHKAAPAAVAGGLFAVGLHMSGMIYPTKVVDFLNVAAISSGTWDPTLAAVMGGGLIVSWMAYQFVDTDTCTAKPNGNIPRCTSLAQLERPIALQPGSKWGFPTSTVIDFDLLAGAVMFGTGWGIAGICPGPAILLGALGVPSILTTWWPSFLVGSYAANAYKQSRV